MNCNYKVKIKDIQNKYQFKIFCKTYDDTEIQGDIETLNSEVEALQEENEYLNNLVEQAFDKKEVEGEELSIDDTINAKMEVGLEGNITQKTTTGKNKFDVNNNLISNTIATSGVTTTINSDGTISTNGTTNRTYINMKYSFELNAGTYIVNGCPTGGSQNGYSSLIEYTQGGSSKSAFDTGSGATITLDVDQTVTFYPIRIGSNSNVNMNNLLFKPMIRLSSITDDTYEKYTGGIASPNPDYPSNVNVVTGDNTIVVSNKNLFDKNNLTNNYRLDSNGQPYADNGYALTDYIKVQPNTQYTRNIDFAWNVPICLYDINKNFISRIQTGKTITTTNDTYYVRTDVAIADIDITQLEKGSTATPYEQHQEQTFQVNLGNIELCGIGDYRDYFYKSKSNNKWYKHSEIGKVVLDGSENFIGAGTSGTDYRYNKTLSSLNIPNATTNNALCMANYFQNVTIKTDKKWGAFYINGNWLVFYDKDNNFENATAFNTWLSTHNTLIYYVLATPTDTEITDTTLISQLEALKTAMSYAGQTNISQINNDAPFILQVTALASYNSRILALENAILNANRSTPVENTRKSNEVIEEPKEEVVDDNKDENIIKEEK